MDSRPPPTATGTPSTMMLRAAIAIACRPEEQKRLTVCARRRHRKPGAQGRLPGDIAARRALRRAAAQRHILDSPGSIPARCDRMGDDMAAQIGAMGDVEGAANGPADRRAGGGNDDGVSHVLFL